MRNICLCILLIAVAAGCVKREKTITGGIHGVARDAETAQPLEGCSVTLVPTGTSAVTGADGVFQFNDLAPDTYTLEASCHNYYSVTKSVVVSAAEGSMQVDVLLTRYDPDNRLAKLGAMRVSDVTVSSARVECELLDQGSTSVTERGFLYSETPNVTIATATRRKVETADDVFSTTLTGLAEQTDYYVAAYAINGRGTAYSEVATFRTGDATSGSAPAGVVFVSVAGDDGNDGSSWTRAKRTIAAGIAVAGEGGQVWVSTGTFGETVRPREGIPVYGGFGGNETTTEGRTGRTTVAGLDCEGSDGGTLADGFEVTCGNPWEAVTLGRNARMVNCRVTGCARESVVATGEATMESCLVEGNEGETRVELGGTLTLVNCFVRGNEEGIWNEGTLRMYGCVVTNNGQGVRAHGGTTTLYNCTVAANGEYGVAAQGGVSLYNCMVWNNRVVENYLGTPGTVTRYSCLEVEGADNSQTKFKQPSASTGAGAADALTADWSIETGSACINAGTTLYFPAEDYPTDIAGNARVTGEAIDIGAYEW